MKRVIFLIIPLMATLNVEAAETNWLFKTRLTITVLDQLGNLVEGATVKLFTTEEDYRSESNQTYETMTTSEKGVVKFKNVETVNYYILVEVAGTSNTGGGVKTEKLIKRRNNRVNTIVNRK